MAYRIKYLLYPVCHMWTYRYWCALMAPSICMGFMVFCAILCTVACLFVYCVMVRTISSCVAVPVVTAAMMTMCHNRCGKTTCQHKTCCHYSSCFFPVFQNFHENSSLILIIKYYYINNTAQMAKFLHVK